MAGYRRFGTEDWFARFEFAVDHLLAPSDCESISVAELLEMAGASVDDLGSVHLGYTESQGGYEYRAAIAATYGLEVGADEIVVLGTPIEGIYLTMRTLLDPGDEVVVLMPCYDALRNLPQDIGCEVREWFVEETDDGWVLDLDRLEALLSDRTKLVVLNFPHNPTGHLPTHDEWSRLLGMLDHVGAWLYHDEIFRGLEHGRYPQLPSAAERYPRSVTLGGLSKAHGLPGLRAGWLVVPDPVMRAEIINTKMYTSICPAAPVEHLATVALSVADRLVTRNRDLVRANLDGAEGFFTSHRDVFRFHRPRSGPVALVGLRVPSATAYCEALATDHGIMLLPSSSLGLGDGHVRFGFGRSSFAESLAVFDAHLRANGVG